MTEECRAIAARIKGGKAYVSASINNEGRLSVGIWPDGIGGSGGPIMSNADTFAEAIAAAHEKAGGLQDERRANALKKKEEAEAELAALDAEEAG